MRVITGSAKGRALKTLEGISVRPTTERVKEAVFSIIQFELEGRRVLDLFAGSGQLGIEALSRGAAQATFIDMDRESIATVKDNLTKTKLAEQAQVIRIDSLAFLQSTNNIYDIAFLDPPYSTGLLEKALDAVGEHVAEGGAVICELPATDNLPESTAAGLSLQKRYRHGKVSIALYRKQV